MVRKIKFKTELRSFKENFSTVDRKQRCNTFSSSHKTFPIHIVINIPKGRK